MVSAFHPHNSAIINTFPGSLTRSGDSDDSGSTTSEEENTPYPQLPQPSQHPDSGTEDEESGEDEAGDLPNVRAEPDLLMSNRPGSSLSAHRYRTPGSLAMSPPLPGSQTPSAKYPNPASLPPVRRPAQQSAPSAEADGKCRHSSRGLPLYLFRFTMRRFRRLTLRGRRSSCTFSAMYVLTSGWEVMKCIVLDSDSSNANVTCDDLRVLISSTKQIRKVERTLATSVYRRAVRRTVLAMLRSMYNACRLMRWN